MQVFNKPDKVFHVNEDVLDILTEYYNNSIGSRYEYTFYIIEEMSELGDVLKG